MNQLNYGSLEACKALHEAGIVVETEAYWTPDPKGSSNYVLCMSQFDDSIPAPSMAEMWRELPGGCAFLHENGETEVWLEEEGHQSIMSESFASANPTDALIHLLIWTRKEKP